LHDFFEALAVAHIDIQSGQKCIAMKTNRVDLPNDKLLQDIAIELGIDISELVKVVEPLDMKRVVRISLSDGKREYY